MFKRILNLSLSETESCFLWGARQTGKSTLLKALFPESKRYKSVKGDVGSKTT